MLFEGKTAIITGASRGLGRAIALRFAAEGAKMVLVATNQTLLEETAALVQEAGGQASVYACDLTKQEAVTAMAEYAVKELGHVDILVNNAGISKELPLAEMPQEVWDQIFDINIRSVVLVIKALLPHMIENKNGNIVNIASAAALRGLPGSTAYCASKAAVVCLSQGLGDELRPHNIRVNAVCPGPIDTELFKKSAKREFILAAGGDVFDPETVANGVVYLASEQSKGMSSQVLTIRGFNRW